MTSRRQLIKLLAQMPLLAALPVSAAKEQASQAADIGLTDSIKNNSAAAILKTIPSSGKQIPAIGMGSYQTFNVDLHSSQRSNLLSVLQAFFKAGGSLIDSSPMYGKSESMLGDLISQIKPQDVFAASKVWTFGETAGTEAIAETQLRMQVEKMDLMQVHNLRDWQVQLTTLNRMKQQQRLDYTGITTSFLGQYKDFEAVMRSQKLDFVQLNYNISVREAEKRLLPLAQDKGIAVIVNMPFEKGRLFKYVKGKKLPEWSQDFDCNTWGQFFLKYIISHPAVTCTIPATSKVHHMQDNMQALYGRLPDASQRKQMQTYFAQL
jgi:diketogulonate reductase-like aldo/keto reductase